MIYSPKSSLRKTSGHYTAQQLYAAFEPMIPADQRERARRLIDRIVVLCVRFDLDEVAVCAIVWIETGAKNTGLPFRSEWWRTGLNAGNLGITGDDEQNAAAQTWQTPEDAANGLVAHVVAYVYGKDWERVWDVDELGQPQFWDWRFDLVLREFKGAKLDTLEALNNRWAIDVDRKYDTKLAERANKLVAAMDPPVTVPSTPEEEIPPMVDTSKLVTGRVPHPPHRRSIVTKPNVQSGYGYDSVQPRKNVGCCWHEWMDQGSSSIPFVEGFFGPGGYRYSNALVDYAIMRDGTIIMLNDPRGTRSPWASGGGVESGGLEGDGPAFYNKFGLGAINSKLISTEIVKTDSENYTAAQIESAAKLAAYWHDQDGQFYFEHPYTTKYGIVTSFLHFEFGTTSCGLGELDDITKVQARTRAIMEQYQTGATEPLPDNPPNVPDLPDLQLPGGISSAKATERFGQLRKIDAKVGTNALLGTFKFDPKGVISLGWAQKCAEVFGTDYDKWPAAGDWIVFQEPIDKNTNDFITFDGWDQNMIRKNEQQGFVWV